MKYLLVFLGLAFWMPNSGLAQVNIDLNVIAAIESSNNPNAFNKSSGCIGLYQINPNGALADWNARKPHNRHLNPEDMYDPTKAKEVASWYLSVQIPAYLKHFGHEVNLENVLAGYNCGVGCLSRPTLPNETLNYVRKYRRLAGV